jgi:sodium/potassium-transporting ATPase subunit alpha
MSEVSLEEIVLAANAPTNSSAPTLSGSKLVPIPRGSVELKRDQTLEDFKASEASISNSQPSGSPRAAATRKSIDNVSDLTAAGVGLSHRVSVEIQSRSRNDIRQSIDDRQKKLQERVVSGAAIKGSSSAQGELNQMNAAKKVADIVVHSYSFAELSTILHTDITQGLTGSDAKTRLHRDGLNRLTPPKQTPWWIKLIKQLVGGFQLMLIGAAILCWVVANLSNPVDQQTNFLGYVLVIVVVVTGIFAFFQEAKSDKVMEGFNALTPSHCHVIRNGIVIECPAEELVVGDVVVVQFGEKVPADLRIIECSNLKVDNSSLTGEAEPLSRTVDMTHENPMESKNIAFYGTFFTEGSGKGVVFQTGDRTFLGTIASAAIGAAQPESTLQRELHYFVKSMACFAVGQGVIFFLIAVFAIKYPILQALIFAIGLITANVPEGLLPQLTIILTLAARRMKKINVLVKNLEIMETLGCITCIASDKTGTLTQNKMTVSHVYYGGAIHNSGGNAVSGAHYPVFEKENRDFTLLQASHSLLPHIPFTALNMLATNHRFLQRCATVCNRAVFVFDNGEIPDMNKIQMWKVHGDASESALIKFCHPISDIGEYRAQYKTVCSIPFNSTNKWQLSIHTTGDADHPHVLLIKGAPERIIKMCSHVHSSGELHPINHATLEAANFELGSRGERVLAFAEMALDKDKFPLGFQFDSDKINFPITNLHFCGLVSLIDPPREGVADAVLTCIKAGIKVVMVTGDHPVTARAIARSVNIMPGETIDEVAKRTGQDVSTIDKQSIDCIVVPGHLLPTYTEKDWEYALSRKQIVFARTMPQQKQDIVAHLQSMNHIVAVTGDGVNDSPALKKADVGVAMGIMGSDVAKEAAKVILMDDNFASIVHGIAEGRLIFDNLKK